MLSVIVTTFNGAHCAVPCVASLMAMASSLNAIELVVVDNASTDGVADEIERYNNALDFKMIRIHENIGHHAAAKVGVEASHCDCIAVLHSDLLMLEKGWNQRVLQALDNVPSIGVVGVFGALIATVDGGRANCMSNLVCAEMHGLRMRDPTIVALVDSMFIAFTRKTWMLHRGFDVATFPGHHFADKDFMMKCWEARMPNYLLPLYCHHFGQIASTSPDSTAKRFSDMHDENSAKYVERWKAYLPTMCRIVDLAAK